MDVLERDEETGEERRGQETKDGGIAEGDLEVKGRMEVKEQSRKEEKCHEHGGITEERPEKGKNEMMRRVDR